MIRVLGKSSLPASVAARILKRQTSAERPLNVTLVIALNPQPLVALICYCICEPNLLGFVTEWKERGN